MKKYGLSWVYGTADMYRCDNDGRPDMKDNIWEKKIKVSYILSIFVILIHFYPTANFEFNNEVNIQLNRGLNVFLREIVAAYAVPLFFVMSGYFFFRNFTPQKYPDKIKSRFRTLVIPYISWNVIMLIWQIFYPLINKHTSNEKYIITVRNVIKSILFYEANFQFWFLFYLIFLVAFSIFFWYLLKNRILGSLFIILVLIIRGCLLIDDRTSLAILFFCTGAFIAIHKKDFFETVNYKSSLISSFIFAVVVIIQLIEKLQGKSINLYIDTLLFYVATICLWKVFDFFQGIPVKKFMSHFFAVYALHPTVSLIVNKVVWRFWWKNEWTAFLYVVACVGMTLVVIELFCVILEKISSRFFNLIMGQRV